MTAQPVPKTAGNDFRYFNRLLRTLEDLIQETPWLQTEEATLVSAMIHDVHELSTAIRAEAAAERWTAAAEPGADPTAAPPDDFAAQRACLEDWAAGLAGGDPAAAVLPGLLACLPALAGADHVPEFEPAPPDDHGDTPDTATPLALDTAASGRIAPAGDVDHFVFAADAGVFYRIDVIGDGLPDPLVALSGPDGEWLAEDDDSGDGLAARLYWEAPAGGSYTLAVESSAIGDARTGTYTLTVTAIDISDDHGNAPASASAVALDAPLAAVIDYATDVDVFAFDAVAGTLYRIDVAVDTLQDSVLTLSDAAGWELARDDDGGEGLGSRLYWEAPAAGRYTVAVASSPFWEDRTGAYTLTVTAGGDDDDHGNAVATATALTVGAATPGVIDYENDRDVFTFEAESGVLYQIDVAPDTLANPVVTLSGPDGEWLAEDDDGGEGLGSRLYWEAPAAGPYTVEVRSVAYGDVPTGSYILTISARLGRSRRLVIRLTCPGYAGRGDYPRQLGQLPHRPSASSEALAGEHASPALRAIPGEGAGASGEVGAGPGPCGPDGR